MNMAEEARWYVAHTYSGYENTVKATIEKAVENRNMGDLILEVNIPMETVTEVTDNGHKTVERKVFPGYVLVKMVMTDETWHLVRNVRGVTGFVGSGNKPIPLTEAEIAWAYITARRVPPNEPQKSFMTEKILRLLWPSQRTLIGMPSSMGLIGSTGPALRLLWAESFRKFALPRVRQPKPKGLPFPAI